MSIRQEVSQSMRRLCKCAQAPGYAPMTGNAQVDAYQSLNNIHLLRGMMRGIKNTIPGLVDGVIGVPSGAIYGLGTGIQSKLNGGSFSDGFKNGFGSEFDYVRSAYSDPIRRMEMALGGNALKKMFNGAQKYHQNTIEKSVGGPTDQFGYPRRPYWEYRNALNDMASIEKGVATGTEMLATVPASIGYLNKLWNLGKLYKPLAASGYVGELYGTAGRGALEWRKDRTDRRNQLLSVTDSMTRSGNEFTDALKQLAKDGYELK